MGQIVCLGLLDSLLTSAAPSGALLVLVTAAGLALGTLVTAGHGARRAAARILLTALGATAAAFVLLVP